MLPTSPLPRGTPPPWTQIEDVVSWALTEVTEGGSGAPTTWWDRGNHQLPPDRPHGACGILSTGDIFGLTCREPSQTNPRAAPRCRALTSPCIVLSYTRRKLGERSALGGGPVLPHHPNTCSEEPWQAPVSGLASPEFGFPLSPTTSHTSSHTSHYLSPTPTTHSTPHPPTHSLTRRASSDTAGRRNAAV